MDIINSVLAYLQDFAAKSEASYHVNPWIFCVLFFGSAIPLYYGYYLIARSVVHFENGKLKKKEVDQSRLKLGIFVSCAAWLLPYVYVFVFGRLPVDILTIFTVFVLLTGFSLIRTLRKRINAAKT